MSKFLVRFNKQTNKFIDMQSVNEEYVHNYYNVEELPLKEGFYVKFRYDENEEKVVSFYEEIPKTQEQLIQEEIEKLKRAIAENTKTENIDLGELEGLNSVKQPDLDLSELDTI